MDAVFRLWNRVQVKGARRVAKGGVRRFGACWVILLGLGVAGCSDSEPERVAWPDGWTAFVSRAPFEFEGRNAFVRIIDDAEREVTVTRAEVASSRFQDVVWTGADSFQRVWDLKFELPTGGCGGDVEAVVTLTYSIGDGPSRTSRMPVEDRYGSIASTLDRDCAETTLREAAEMRLGEPWVTGRGRASVFVLPVTFTPTGDRDDVAFAGIDGTVLFRQVAGTASEATGTRIPLTGDPASVRLRLVPARCDMHALAEGKRGTFIPARVQAPELDSGASFYLPLGEERRGALMEFFASHCGF